ncbi:putative adenylate kinase [Mycobacterium kansasii]|uniref:Putative adenylate kinase n=1 Tax=Mycobacterium kansasii TaxID=1768 RepID=A0A1V3WMF5_MYCKA|nr:putative adenylate kinase [Mycobacterium kansasii]
MEQAKALHEMLERRGTDIDAVLEFRVSEGCCWSGSKAVAAPTTPTT